MADILIVDDERLVRVLGKQACSRLGHNVLEADNLADGLELAARGVDLILLDVMLPDGDGITQVRNFSSMPGNPDVLIITGFGDGDSAAKALETGALDYLVKPLQLKDIEDVVERSLAWRQQRFTRMTGFDCPGIIGKSKVLLEVLNRMAEASVSDVNVLILGETGVGKELIAKAVHENSHRKQAGCVTLDCASLPPTLLAAQLFGHAKGAFTGADRSREGLLRAADRGTLFLDEVGELPLDVQGAFLRALDVKKFRPVGEKKEVESDFRLVAATNKNLTAMVDSGSFRGDLLYRLRGISIYLPPLRERIEDVPLLIDYFLERLAEQQGVEKKSAGQDFLDALATYSWPGNIRELRHVVHSSAVRAGTAEKLHVHHLSQDLKIAISRQRFGVKPASGTGGPLAEPSGDPSGKVFFNPLPWTDSGELPSLKECRLWVEAVYLEELLKRSGHDMTRASALAGVSRGHLYELLKKHGN